MLISDVQEKALSDAATRITADGKGQVITPQVDVRVPSQVDEWIKTTVAKFGFLDGAANLAGVSDGKRGRTPITDQDEADWEVMQRIKRIRGLWLMRA